MTALAEQLSELPDQQFSAGQVDWATGATSLYDPTSSRTNPQSTPLTGDNLANFYLGVAEYQAQLNRGFFYYRAKEYASYYIRAACIVVTGITNNQQSAHFLHPGDTTSS